MAGGSGTRLRPLTVGIPKPMVPVFNRPAIVHTIDLLKRHGIDEIIVTLHYLPEVIQSYCTNGQDLGVKIHYTTERERPLGTAGSVKNNEELLTDTFLVISGDCLTDFDLTAAIDFHRQQKAEATLVLTRVPNPLEYGIVVTDDSQRVTRFLEKPSSSELFSDTINTGIYILEPSILKNIPPQEAWDFSRDLFPQLLAENRNLVGYIASGYWCDIGDLDTYQKSQSDALFGQVNLNAPYPARQAQIWVGANTTIAPTAIIEAPACIGANCRIGDRVIVGAGTTIGDNSQISAGAMLVRSTLWGNVSVGENTETIGCTLATGVHVGDGVKIGEGAIVGADTKIGEEAQIAAGVKIWPHKEVEALAAVKTNLIWGQIAHRNLFSQRGVMGLANIDITPEFAVKLGAAYGSILPMGAQVTVSRDQRTISQTIAIGSIAGLMSAGINVCDLDATAIPVARTIVPTLHVSGGIHIRLHPERRDAVTIEFFDRDGINIGKSVEKQIEAAFFKEELRRVSIGEIGSVTSVRGLDIYKAAFERQIQANVFKNNGMKIAIDYAYAVSGAILPLLLNKLGCDAVVLNASLYQTTQPLISTAELLDRLGRVVVALEANFGVQVSAHGEKLVLVDETGVSIDNEHLSALIADLMLYSKQNATIVVPLYSSSAIETIAARYRCRVQRTKANPTALMEACQSRQNGNVIVGGSGDMGFIFPELHPGFDAMFCVAKILELLVKQNRSLGEIRSQLPMPYHQKRTIRCPWSVKGGLMRHLLNLPIVKRSRLETIDGVKIFAKNRPHCWILILPAASDASVTLYVNGDTPDWVAAKMAEFTEIVEDFVSSSASQQRLS